jgi:quaternary ammonium compound-resistance protein SugE
MPWILLTIAGLLEVGWAVAMKLSRGWTRPGPSVVAVVLMIASFVLLARAMRDLPAGTAYAVWTGIGTVGVAIVGMAVLREPVTPARVVCIGLIVGGIVGLKLASPEVAGETVQTLGDGSRAG